MVSEMKERIANEGGIPGELEHPQMMNITLENISHKITDINIDENGLVTGSITLLNTPKGKIAQAIVEGGLPLFISSRATGQVDSKTGNVTLEKISTYDLVGSPGFSQARLKLNENQVAESICESVYYITEKENQIEENDMELKEILEKIEALESKIQDLESENESLREELNEKQDFDLEKFANGVQKWIIEQYSPVVQQWVMEEYSPANNDDVIAEAVENAVENMKDHIVENLAPAIQKWVVEQFSPEIEKWCINEFAPGIQQWVVEEYAPDVEKWLNESFAPKLNEKMQELISESKGSSLNAIDQTLKVLESLEVVKPTYSRKAIISENADEPMYIQNMPAEARVKWDLASAEVKESIMRRAKLYNFINEGAVERFWNTIDFAEVKPVHNIYEGLEQIEDERERAIRAKIRSGRFGRR
jgi:hypothetical protein